MKVSPFAVSNGKFYVMIDASGIHPLVPFIDGMKIIKFPQWKQIYLFLDDAIEWHENELKNTNGQSGSTTALNLLKQPRANMTAKAVAP